jgi:DMSO/TMAO reductase YedYZ molybdopterin-dependent catalytic subunit
MSTTLGKDVVRIPTEDDFTSSLRSPAVASRVGVWLGICFGLAFVTGVISHEAYVAHPVIPFPTRPTWGYRVTQGVHVLSGTAAIPLLLVKLWSVFPKLFVRPPRQLRELMLHALERASIGVLVAAAIFELASGLANASQWYPWAFHFRATHYAMAWIAIGALLVHIAVKLPITRAALAGDIDDRTQDRPASTVPGPVTRRGLVRGALLASGVAVLATAGSTVPVLRKVSVFGVRSGDGPAGIPINKSARAADVTAAALSPDYRLVVAYDGREQSFSRADLEQLDQRTVELPIACVEGWSANGHWTGVRVRDLLDLVDAPRDSDVRVVSLQEHGPFRETTLPGHFADDPLTLLALGLSGDPLAIDHGYPCRLIAPNRPGVLQTKWVGRLEVLT